MKVHEYHDRRTGRMESEISPNTSGLTFLYHNAFGKLLAGLLFSKPWISAFYGWYVKRRSSRSKIRGFVEQYHIRLDEIKRPMDSFISLNDFFIRELKPGSRPIDPDPTHLISPADSRLMVFDLARQHDLPVKGYWYSLRDFLQDDTLVREFENGWCFVYRLAPCDYHRFCYIDNGQHNEVRRIKGVLHSVNPIALSAVDALMAKNYRELTVLHTDNFDVVLHLEIGALMVGKVVQHNQQKGVFKRGDEKGWFEFGGSTLVLLFKKEAVKPDEDILQHSENHTESLVRMGEKVGDKG